MPLPPLIPFPQFIDSLRAATPANFSLKINRSVNEEKFETTRHYILNYYSGIDAVFSFNDKAGQTWDCVPLEKQPSLKFAEKKVAPIPDGIEKGNGDNEDYASYSLQDITDEDGNKINCPASCIPLRRLTLEDLTVFDTLRDFFQKSPRNTSADSLFTSPQALNIMHKYAYATQIVNNAGGSGYLNVWQPRVTGSQVFSLSQHWYTAGVFPRVQTVEAGWHVYPQLYKGSLLPHLFIYWTADSYQHTGCYNNDCGAFVQTNPRWLIGGPLTQVSVPGGRQVEFQVAWRFLQGNWWLFLQGLTAREAVGYYPGALFKNGPLITQATSIVAGGEVAGSSQWGQMGSGQYAIQGVAQAAYQRNIQYYNADGSSAPAVLTTIEPSPNCFTIKAGDTNQWGSHFFYGGPGGNACT